MSDYNFEGWMGLDASAADGKMVWKRFETKPWEETDIDIKVTHSGICGSDLHALRSSWGPANYPLVVGHEIVGVAVRVGSEAEGNFKVGDIVGVGAQADSCLGRGGQDCIECSDNAENYCPRGVFTYGGPPHRNGGPTRGGHALYHRCPSHFVFKIPAGLAPEHAAPMLCAGVTVYSPLKKFGAGPGKKVGVIGLGGLGHLAVLFAKALGASEVVGFSRQESKRKDAQALGCDDYIATGEEADWSTNHARHFDLIISTVGSAKMPFAEYLKLLKRDGTLVQVGMPDEPMVFHPFTLGVARRRIAGSGIGSPKEIIEMLELAADKKIESWVEVRPMSEANQAIVDMEAGKPRFRYVLVN
ncbi:hypothetical protein NW754_003871 [Fusarium falciforme]|nr:hypothetical protein NW754_003871 [Fusarium falciforme]